MRMYKSKSSAHRAARNAGLSKDEYHIVEEDGQFGFQALEAAIEEPVVEEEPETPVAEGSVVEDESSAGAEEAKTVGSIPLLRKSQIGSPSKTVWHIADDMHKANPDVRRKDVIAACVERGIAYYTARTQYQLWFKATKGEV